MYYTDPQTISNERVTRPQMLYRINSEPIHAFADRGRYKAQFLS